MERRFFGRVQSQADLAGPKLEELGDPFVTGTVWMEFIKMNIGSWPLLLVALQKRALAAPSQASSVIAASSDGGMFAVPADDVGPDIALADLCCEVCGRSFASAGGLSVHMAKAHQASKAAETTQAILSGVCPTYLVGFRSRLRCVQLAYGAVRCRRRHFGSPSSNS